MIFNSYIFILLFLPAAVTGYFLIQRFGDNAENGRRGLVWLLGMSLLFYAYDDIGFLLLFLGSILLNYLFGKELNRRKAQGVSQGRLKCLLTAGILGNLLPLGYCKYGDFFVDSIEDFFHAEWNVDVLLPLGISFYTFMQIAYLVDCYRDQKVYDYTFTEYAVYMAFFPKITMGPIALHWEIIPQFRDRDKRQINYDNLSQGLYAFALGLAKKVLLADTLAKMVNAGYKEVYYLNTATALAVALSYTLQLYFDFSGYCDMAAGIAKMFNIEMPVNFNSPYKAKSIGEFWDRWHMTLTRFFTRYVYIPLGGSRKGKCRTYINTMIVFLLSGLWHGAEWSFVFWGFLHGIFMTGEKVMKDLGCGRKKVSGKFGKIADGMRWLGTFVLVNFAWVFFRAEDMKIAGIYFRQLFSGGWHCQEYITRVFEKVIEIRILLRLLPDSIVDRSADVFLWLMLLFLVYIVVFTPNVKQKVMTDRYRWVRSGVTVFLLVWCVISLSEVSEFLYFNF